MTFCFAGAIGDLFVLTAPMSYVSNPWIPKVRRLAVNDVLLGRLSKSDAARKYGVHRATIGKWIDRAAENKKEYIDTQSSRPHSHPNELSQKLVDRVIELRKETKRCAPVLHTLLQREGVNISLSSVERVLRKYHLTRKKKQLKPPFAKVERPSITACGDLVEVDTIHFVKPDYSRFFIYSAIDLYSRMAYAEYHPRLSASRSFRVIGNTKTYFNFPISHIQTDNGAEFSEQLYWRLKDAGIVLCHTRVGRPNDNAHIERFNRTIQEECFGSRLPREENIQSALKEYISFYNYSRPHLSLNCLTPSQMLPRS